MNKFSLIALLGASALGLSACGSHTSTTNTTTSTATTNTVAPAAPAGGNSAAPAGGDEAASGSESQSGGGAEHNQNFTLVNHSGHTLVTLNVSASNDNQWGPDILGRDTLANGESADITFPRGEQQCNWDIRATYDDNDTTDQRGVNLCETTTVTITGG